MKDKDRRLKHLQQFEDSYFNNDLFKEYLNFSLYIQDLFLSDGGYIIDTGNFETANLELINLIEEKIRKHPFLFKLFFEVA